MTGNAVKFGTRTVRLECSAIIRCAIVAAVSIVFAGPNPAFAAEQRDNTRIFGFLPVLGTQSLARHFEPLVDYLAEKTGVAIVFETAPDYREFVRRTHEERRYDYLFTAPHLYYLAQQSVGYRAVARIDGGVLRPLVVVRRDSGLSETGDLCARTITTPDPISLVTIMVRKHLDEAGCRPGRGAMFVSTPSHGASLMSAYLGDSDAAAIGSVPYGRVDAAVRAEMFVLLETENAPNIPLAVAPWISDEEMARFVDVLTNMAEDEGGQGILAHLSWPGLVRTEAGEFEMFQEYVLVSE